MKKFLNTASIFAKHGANISFRILMAFMIVLAASTQMPGLVQFLPHVAAICMAIYTFTHVFTGKRSQNLSFSATQADIFNVTQLQKKDIVTQALRSHYGNSRELPLIDDKLRIVKHDLYQTKYLTIGTDSFDFFNQTGDPNKPLEHNFDFATLPPNKLWVFFGIRAELATGASAADTSDILLFNSPTLVADAPVLNSQVTFKINSKIEIDRNPFKELFVNDDAVKSYHRFEEPIAWEPGGQIQLTFKLAKAYGAAVFRYLRPTLVGIELTV